MFSSTDTRPKLAWIQALRGFAVLFVVLTHARYFFLDTPGWPLADALLLPGAMGVDLFFVISGFIMVYTTRKLAGTPRIPPTSWCGASPASGRCMPSRRPSGWPSTTRDSAGSRIGPPSAACC